MGTTYVDMFDPMAYCLFAKDALRDQFADWDVLLETFDDFPAPGHTVKAFATLIARKRNAS